MDNIFKYCGYLCVSLFLGWVSTLSEHDFIRSISTSIIPILLTLTVLHTSLTGIMINELLKYSAKHQGLDVLEVVNSMKRSALIELIIIFAAFIVLVMQGAAITLWPCAATVVIIAANSVVSFAFIYFLLVLLDTIRAWYALLNENHKSS